MIAGARDNQLGFDKTVIGKIISISNAEIGEYWVEYQEGRFKAYASTINPETVYQAGSSVYIKIPSGDFSNKKIIEGIANLGSGLVEVFDYEREDLKEVWGFFEDTETYSILAGAQKDNIYYEKVIYENETEKVDTSFKNVFESYPNIKISAEFKTDFHGDPQYGNYGLLIEFYTVDEEGTSNKNKTFTLRLDIANFSGSLWEYYIFSPQYAVYQITTAKLSNIKKITFFQENLNYDKIGNEINDSKPNIFVRNIRMTLNEIVQDNGTLYDYGIIPVGGKGVTFLNNSDSITFQAYLTYAKKDILTQDNCQVLWFKQNPEVVIGHQYYNSYAGPGWKQITDIEKVDFNLLRLKGTDIYDKENIRAIIIYNQSKTFIIDKTLTNNSMPRFSIIKKAETDGTYLYLLDGFPEDKDKPTTADWYVLLDDGKYLKCNSELTEKIKINDYMLHSKATFTAWIEVKDNQTDTTFKVPYNYIYINDNEKNSVNIVFAGPDTFLYNDAGAITYSEASREMLIIPTITLGQNTVIKSITWKGPEDLILTSIPFSNENSMLLSLWVDNENVIHFHIRQSYNMTKTKNTITAIIETVDGNTFSFNKVINFVKQGEQGTGGTSYTLVIEQCDKDGNEIEYSPMVYGISKTWSPIYLRPQMYLNGDIIRNGDNVYDENKNIYSISYKVQKIGVDVELVSKQNANGETINTDYYKVTGVGQPTDAEQGQYFVRFVGEVSNGKDTHTISYYHPVLVGVGYIQPSDLIINNLPNNVVYSSLGTNPTYNKQPIDVKYNGQSQTNFSAPTSMTPSTISITSSSSYGYYLYPAESYTGANFTINPNDASFKPMGAIKIKLAQFIEDTYIIQPVAMVLSTQLTQNLDGYDGTSIYVVDEENLEKEKEMTNVFGVGDVSSSLGADGYSKNTISNGAIIATDDSNEKAGLYEYDKEGTPINVIRCDGYTKLGNGYFELDDGGLKIANKVFSVTTNSDNQQEVTLSFGTDLSVVYHMDTDGNIDDTKTLYRFGQNFLQALKQEIN